MNLAVALRRFGPIALSVCLLIAVFATGLWRRLSLSELATHRAALSLLVARHPALSLLAFIGAYVVVVLACTPGPGFMSTAGGFLFGTWLGGAANLFSLVVGSSLVFLACRTAFGDWAARRAGPVVARLEAGFTASAFSWLLTLRLIPIVPYFATNIAAGLMRVRLRDLAGATLVGSAPVSFILAGLGAGLGGLFDAGVKVDARLFARPQILAPLAGLALLSAASIAWRAARKTPR
jgi:uncharacterized membrane protein YdjX (TVP38/TMEM64 family)